MAKKTVVVALIIILALSLAFGLVACKKSEPIPSDPDDIDQSEVNNNPSTVDITDFFTAEELATFNYDVTKYTSSSQVGFSSKTLGTVDRYRPVEDIRDERDVFPLSVNLAAGALRYPRYGYTMSTVTGNDPDGLKIASRRALINEANYLTATGTATAGGGQFTWMDEHGYLYRGTRANPTPARYEDKTTVKSGHRQLYKHTVADTMYGGKVSDSEQGLVQQIKYRPRSNSYGYYITGLYAPAGEVIKVEMSGANMNATGGITIHIGQCLYNGKNNNIWAEKGAMNRFPMIMNTMSLTKNTMTYDAETDTWTGYVGSFVGGPIYIRNKSVTFDVTISGGVAYRHFILGYTSQKEFEETSKSTVPYFDLDVWDCGVLLSGPLSQARKFSYEDLYKAAVLWDKVASVTTTNGTKQGIVFLFDPFVAAGAAVAFPGQGSVNCPSGWMSGALNYNALVTSGSWGNFHEYHHNFQNYGLGSGADGEVTNNGLNLVSYSLFTKISANRGINSYGAQGMSGWNRYTSATWALNQVNAGSIGSTNGLAIYATLLHNLGQDAYIKSRGARGTAYLDKWANNTHQDMTYFASAVRSYGFQSGGNYTPSTAVQNANYPLFVPVASVYQTGRSYMYNDVKRDIKTMQPYVIPFGYNFTVDLRPYTVSNNQYASGSVIIGNGFKYTLKNVTQPENGRLVESETKDVYTYIPDTNAISLLSGQIRVTIEITTTDGAKEWNGHRLDDVDLILEFQQTHESKKTTLERTVYNYDSSNMYTDAVTAYEAGFAGYSSVSTRDHSNPTQNANTDIWFYDDTPDNRNKYPNSPESYFIHDNHIEIVDGKLNFADGKYRIYLRGRSNCALYFSLSGFDNTYKLCARITKDTPFVDKNQTFQFRNDPTTYFDVQFSQGKVTITTSFEEEPYEYTIEIKEGKQEIENWLYIKEVLIVQKSSRSFIGVGQRQWTAAAFIMTEKYYKADDTEINPDSDTFDEDYAYTKTVYTNQAGSEVAYSRKDKPAEEDQDSPTYYYKKVGNNWEASTLEEVTELTRNRMIEPDAVTAKSQPSYSTAYRRSYEFPDNKGFTSEYFYKRSYNYNFSYSDRVDYKLTPTLVGEVSHAPWDGTLIINNLFDGKTNTSYHTIKGRVINEDDPFQLVADLGQTIKANHVIFHKYHKATSLDQYGMPKTFTLYGSLDGEDWFEIATYEDMETPSIADVTLDFDSVELRYYKLYVTKTTGNYFAMSEIEFYYYNPEKDLALKGNGANNLSLDNRDMFRFSESNWSGMSTESIFGHIYVGKTGSTLKFEFEGTRIGFITSQGATFDNNFEVYVDGKKVNSVDLWPVSGAYGITYLSERLSAEIDENGEVCNRHVVMLKCKGLVGLDSVVYYKE